MKLCSLPENLAELNRERERRQMINIIPKKTINAAPY